MIDWEKRYNSKLLLFGEYTVLKGSSALALVLPTFYGKWERCTTTDPNLIGFFDHLALINKPSGLKFKSDYLADQIKQGIRFNSSIREGYGLGSSGALSAASFDAFFEIQSPLSLSSKKEILAQIENYFHGNSSGLDALAIYENKTIRIDQGDYRLLDFKITDLSENLFLIDSGVNRSSFGLIDHFMNEILPNKGNQKSLERLIALNNLSIDASIERNMELFYEGFKGISEIQYELFNRMIHPTMNKIWHNGLTSGDYYIKILGAGGGGYYLGYSDKIADLALLQSIQLINQSS